MSTDGYFVKFGGTVLGPADHDYLQRLVHGGAIQAETMVRDGELGEWVPASSVAEISLLLEERCAISSPKDSNQLPGKPTRAKCFLPLIIAIVLAIFINCIPIFMADSDLPGGGAAGWLYILTIPAASVLILLGLLISIVVFFCQPQNDSGSG